MYFLLMPQHQIVLDQLLYLLYRAALNNQNDLNQKKLSRFLLDIVEINNDQ